MFVDVHTSVADIILIIIFHTLDNVANTKPFVDFQTCKSEKPIAARLHAVENNYCLIPCQVVE